MHELFAHCKRSGMILDIDSYLYLMSIWLKILRSDFMEYNLSEYALIFKALADETRLKIVKLLSSDEMCACQLLENFNITQPTLSYHMKILCDSGIVKGRREGAWMYYCNNNALIKNICGLLSGISAD